MSARNWFRTLLEALVIDIRVIWMSLLVPAGVILLVHIVTPPWQCETVLVTAASVLQILGIGQVAWGIHQLRVDLGQPTLRTVFAAWAGKLKSLLPFAKPTHRAITGVGAISIGSSQAFGRAVVINPESIESRVTALESQVKSLQEDLQKQTGEINRRIESLSAETRTALVKRQEETREVRSLLDRVLVGGLDLEVAGLAWILIGQVLTTWPAVIAGWIPGILC